VQLFYRLHTDGTRTPVDLTSFHAGPTRSACWIIGGGPSLADLPCEAISRSPVPRFAINLAGSGLLRPTFWTSYDPSSRFHRSVYLDASIVKFVHARRAMDLVPETAFKVCECPATLFFDRDTRRGYADFLAAGQQSVIDWNDSLLQAIDIAYRLGFRVLYLAGCEMHVRPSDEMLQQAGRAGVEYSERELLDGFFRRCEEAALVRDELALFAWPRQYHFDESKPLAAAIQTDLHYFRVAQYLRLARRALALAGMELVSVTPTSRLNDYFEYRPATVVLEQIARDTGDPLSESTRGLYTGTGVRTPPGIGAMKDYRPHHWAKAGAGAKQPDTRGNPKPAKDRATPRRLSDAVAELPEIHIGLAEIG
jgi:hypothetical protein